MMKNLLCLPFNILQTQGYHEESLFARIFHDCDINYPSRSDASKLSTPFLDPAALLAGCPESPTSIPRRLAGKMADTLSGKARKHVNSPNIQYFGVFLTHAERRYLLSGAGQVVLLCLRGSV
jgi:hypothetical protein